MVDNTIVGDIQNDAMNNCCESGVKARSLGGE